MRRRSALFVAGAAVVLPGMMAVSSCVQDLPSGSPPEAGSDGTTPAEAGPDVGADVTADGSESGPQDASGEQADVVDAGGEADGGEANDAASDIAAPNDASDAATVSDASDASVDGGDASLDGGDAASDASVSPCTLIASSPTECQAGGTCTMSLPQSSTPGDLLVAVFAVSVNTAPSTPTNWTQAILQGSSSGQNVGIWYYPNNPGGIASVSMNGGASNSVRGEISEWRNVTALDQTASVSSTSAASLTVSTALIAASGECAIAAFAEKLPVAQTLSFVAGSGWTTLVTNGTTSTNFHLANDYLLSPATAQVSETETTGVTGDWVGAMATFR
jgi:hypothetical protein